MPTKRAVHATVGPCQGDHQVPECVALRECSDTIRGNAPAFEAHHGPSENSVETILSAVFGGAIAPGSETTPLNLSLAFRILHCTNALVRGCLGHARVLQLIALPVVQPLWRLQPQKRQQPARQHLPTLLSPASTSDSCGGRSRRSSPLCTDSNKTTQTCWTMTSCFTWCVLMCSWQPTHDTGQRRWWR